MDSGRILHESSHGLGAIMDTSRQNTIEFDTGVEPFDLLSFSKAHSTDNSCYAGIHLMIYANKELHEKLSIFLPKTPERIAEWQNMLEKPEEGKFLLFYTLDFLQNRIIANINKFFKSNLFKRWKRLKGYQM